MVYLSKIYTRTGDDGTTSLGDGTRRPKDDARVAGYGDVDELNAVLGLLASLHADFPERDLVLSVSNDLFDVGADLCVPGDGEGEESRLRVAPSQIEKLEKAIDRLNDGLTPLKSFVLPGGAPAAAWCHLARTVCRRAERSVVHLARAEPVNPLVLVYLNRLSDLLFVLARRLNQDSGGDVLWRPGAGR
jgi:cob(I)alamin adenosyltransferase